MPFLSVIITTNGSEQLYYSICALREQMRPMDELLVVSNGRSSESRKIVLGTIGNRPNIWFIEEDPTDNPGKLLESGWKRARGVRLLFLTERDLIVRGALDIIREKGEEYDEFPLLFLSKKIDGTVDANVLVPYNNWPGSVTPEAIIHSQGKPVLINEIVVLSEVQIDPAIQSIHAAKSRTPSRTRKSSI